MLTVVSRLQIASIGTGRWGIALGLAEGKELVAHVGVVAIAVKGSIDSAAELGGTIVASNSGRWGVLVVS